MPTQKKTQFFIFVFFCKYVKKLGIQISLFWYMKGILLYIVGAYNLQVFADSTAGAVAIFVYSPLRVFWFMVSQLKMDSNMWRFKPIGMLNESQYMF